MSPVIGVSRSEFKSPFATCVPTFVLTPHRAGRSIEVDGSELSAGAASSWVGASTESAWVWASAVSGQTAKKTPSTTRCLVMDLAPASEVLELRHPIWRGAASTAEGPVVAADAGTLARGQPCN